MFRDLQEGILLEFAERAAQNVPSLPFGFRLISDKHEDREGTVQRLSGRECRALGLCPDCAKAPQEGRMRCVPCAKTHASKCKAYHETKRKKAA